MSIAFPGQSIFQRPGRGWKSLSEAKNLLIVMHIGSKSSYQSLYVSERYEKRFLLIIGDNFSDHDWDEDQRHQPLLSLSWALQCSAWQGFWCSRTNGDGNGGDDHCSWWRWWRNKEVWFSFVLFSVLAALTRWVIAVETNWPKLGTGSQSKVAKITKSQWPFPAAARSNRPVHYQLCKELL